MTTQEYRELPKRSLKAGELEVGMFLATAYNFTEISEVKVMPKTVRVGYKISNGKTLYWNMKRDKSVQIKHEYKVDLKAVLVDSTISFFQNDLA